MLTLIFKIFVIRFCFYLKQLKAITKLARVNQEVNIELSVVKLVNGKLEKQVTDLQRNQVEVDRSDNKGCHRLFKNVVQWK